MITEKGQHVKLFLRNGMVLEGYIEEVSDAVVVLKSLDGESLMVLHRPSEDIMMTKVVLREMVSEPETENQTRTITAPNSSQEQVKEKLQEVLEQEDEDLQKMSIEELRQLVIEQERLIIANKKREHFGTAGAAKMTQYTSPYTPMRTVGRKIVGRSPYQPGQIPSWAYGRPPKGK